MRKTILKVFITISMAIAPTLHPADSLAEPPAIRAAQVRGGGRWKTHGKAQQAAQRWNLELQRGAGNTLQGTVSLSGSPLATLGTVNAEINGSSVSGTITGEDGQLVARISGEITKQGFKGTYTDRTGEVGDWEWEGELPQ